MPLALTVGCPKLSNANRAQAQGMLANLLVMHVQIKTEGYRASKSEGRGNIRDVAHIPGRFDQECLDAQIIIVSGVEMLYCG